MPDIAFPQQSGSNERTRRSGLIVFFLILAIGLGYVALHLANDLESTQQSSVLAYFLLGIALLIALGFEFVNGFHDTANAVATVI